MSGTPERSSGRRCPDGGSKRIDVERETQRNKEKGLLFGKKTKVSTFSPAPKESWNISPSFGAVVLLPTVFRRSGMIRPAGFGCVGYWAVQSSDGARGRHVQPLVKWAVFLFTFRLLLFVLLLLWLPQLGQLAAAKFRSACSFRPTHPHYPIGFSVRRFFFLEMWPR